MKAYLPCASEGVRLPQVADRGIRLELCVELGWVLQLRNAGCGIATDRLPEPSSSHLSRDPGNRGLSLTIRLDRSRLFGNLRGKWVCPSSARAKRRPLLCDRGRLHSAPRISRRLWFRGA